MHSSSSHDTAPESPNAQRGDDQEDTAFWRSHLQEAEFRNSVNPGTEDITEEGDTLAVDRE
jgi:hypothetical protein